MTTTGQQTSPSKKPAEHRPVLTKRDEHRAEKPAGGHHVEPLDWRGEGVVGNNHTD
jgi:hypothetical protein